MRRPKAGLLGVVLAALALTGLSSGTFSSTAAAQPALPHDPPGARSPAGLQPGQELTYSEVGGPVTEPFDLTEATYELDVLANYSSYDDPERSGECLFLADVRGGETPASFDLSDYLDIGGTFTYHISPVWILSGLYQLYVEPETTCSWTVHVLDLGQAVFARSGQLLPTPVHDEMCLPQAYTDGSDQSQVDLYGTNCDFVTKTLGVDAARQSGRSFRTEGFTCLSTAEGPGSRWAASWHGTYYTYDCTAKGSQAAFNWGRHYAFKPYSGALVLGQQYFPALALSEWTKEAE